MHLTKFWDKAMLEEIHDIHMTTVDQKERIEYLTHGTDGNIVDPPMMWTQVSSHDKEINQLKLVVQHLAESFYAITEFLDNLPSSSTKTNVPYFCLNKERTFLLGFGISLLLVAVLFSLLK